MGVTLIGPARTLAFASLLVAACVEKEPVIHRERTPRRVENDIVKVDEDRRGMVARIEVEMHVPRSTCRSMIYEHMQKEREVAKPLPAPTPTAAQSPVTPDPAPEELSQETLAVIAAAVASYLGKTVRVRGARRLPQEEVSTWAQQGRVYIQASHNLEISHHA